MNQFHFNPNTYAELMAKEVPAYDTLQDEIVKATEGVRAERILDLGTGIGETLARVSEVHPGAALTGVDVNPNMLARAKHRLSSAELMVARLEDPLPSGSFDLVVSALAVHHLDAEGKRDLFKRIRQVLSHKGRFILGDVIIPDNPAESVAPVDNDYDKPSRLDEQLRWLTAVGFVAQATWVANDLAVIRAQISG